MRQKKIKALRKALGYKINRQEKEDREYQTFVSSTKMKKIYQFGANGYINVTERLQDCYQTECVSGGRKLYQEMKKRLKRFGYEGSELMSMPDQDDINKLVEQAKNEMEEQND